MEDPDRRASSALLRLIPALAGLEEMARTDPPSALRRLNVLRAEVEAVGTPSRLPVLLLRHWMPAASVPGRAGIGKLEQVAFLQVERTGMQVLHSVERGHGDVAIALELGLTIESVRRYREGFATLRPRADVWTREHFLQVITLWTLSRGEPPSYYEWSPTKLRSKGDSDRLERWSTPLKLDPKVRRLLPPATEERPGGLSRAKDVAKELGRWSHALALAEDYERHILAAPLIGWELELRRRAAAHRYGEARALNYWVLNQ